MTKENKHDTDGIGSREEDQGQWCLAKSQEATARVSGGGGARDTESEVGQAFIALGCMGGMDAKGDAHTQWRRRWLTNGTVRG